MLTVLALSRFQKIIFVILFNKQPWLDHLMILFIIQIQKKAGWIKKIQQFLTIYTTSVWNMNFYA